MKKIIAIVVVLIIAAIIICFITMPGWLKATLLWLDMVVFIVYCYKRLKAVDLNDDVMTNEYYNESQTPVKNLYPDDDHIDWSEGVQ